MIELDLGPVVELRASCIPCDLYFKKLIRMPNNLERLGICPRCGNNIMRVTIHDVGDMSTENTRTTPTIPAATYDPKKDSLVSRIAYFLGL